MVEAQKLRSHLGAVTYLPSLADTLAETVELTDAALAALSQASRHLDEAEQGFKHTDEPELKAQLDKLRSDHYYLRKLRASVKSLSEFLSSRASDAVRRRAYFLTGDAGSGKTHLLLNTARIALDEGRPAAVLFGIRFGEGNLWQAIGEQLGLPPLGQEEILGALSACAEAASPNGRRFLLAIDAINETPDASFWSRHLPTIVAAASQWPHVALAVSCRTTYVDVVDPDHRREVDFVHRAHPGFAGREL
jgi:hypothetical protein